MQVRMIVQRFFLKRTEKSPKMFVKQMPGYPTDLDSKTVTSVLAVGAGSVQHTRRYSTVHKFSCLSRSK